MLGRGSLEDEFTGHEADLHQPYYTIWKNALADSF